MTTRRDPVATAPGSEFVLARGGSVSWVG